MSQILWVGKVTVIGWTGCSLSLGPWVTTIARADHIVRDAAGNCDGSCRAVNESPAGSGCRVYLVRQPFARCQTQCVDFECSTTLAGRDENRPDLGMVLAIDFAGLVTEHKKGGRQGVCQCGRGGEYRGGKQRFGWPAVAGVDYVTEPPSLKVEELIGRA